MGAPTRLGHPSPTVPATSDRPDPAPENDPDEIPWTAEARGRLERAPAFVRPGIVKLMARRASERGRTVIDSVFLTEIRNESMLLVAKCLRGLGVQELSMDAFELARARMRKLPRKLEVIGEIERFLEARTEPNPMALARFRRYLELIPERGLPWTEEAISRIERVPEAIRPLASRAVEDAAREGRERLVTGEVLDRALAGLAARPGPVEGAPRTGGPIAGVTMLWTAEAEERLRRVPLAPVREWLARRAEEAARARGLSVVDGTVWEAASARGDSSAATS